MIRRSVAGAILGLSLLIGSFAWSGFVALRTVFDPDRSREVAVELLDNDEVRAQVAENLAFAIRGIVPNQVPVEPALIDQVTLQLMESPAVEATLLDAFANTHAAFLGQGDAPDRVDLTPVAQVAREALVAASPELDGLVGDNVALTVPLPTEHIPDASPVRSGLQTVVPALAGIAIAGAAIALITTSDRPSILRRAGFWALGTTAIYLIIGFGVPYLLREFAPDQAEVLAALLAALLRSTLVPSIVLGACGVGLLGLSGLWVALRGRERAPRSERRSDREPSRARRRVSEPDQRRGRPEPARAAQAPTPGPYVAPADLAPTGHDPYGRPAPQPQVRQQPQQQPRAETHPVPTPQPQRAPRRAQAAPDDPGPAQAPSPYPDADHWAATHGEPAAPSPQTQPAPQDVGWDPQNPPSDSIFADVPLPAEQAQPGAEQAQLPAEQARPAASNSVFGDPAPVPTAPHAPSTPSPARPPAGARWHQVYGWVLDPSNPEPRPVESVWVDGVGWTLPVDRGH